MGLDVALGVVILIAAIRGWLQGFLYQVIRIGGLIASVYLAAPVRDQAKPYVATYLPSLKPDLLDRLLWWPSASVCYIVIVGAATLALKMTKRPEIPGMPSQRSRNDQFAGFLLGIAKGGLIGAFLVSRAGQLRVEADRVSTLGRETGQVVAGPAVERSIPPRREDLDFRAGPSFRQPYPAHGSARPGRILARRRDGGPGGSPRRPDSAGGPRGGHPQGGWSGRLAGQPAGPAGPQVDERQAPGVRGRTRGRGDQGRPRRRGEAQVRLTPGPTVGRLIRRIRLRP